LHIILRLTVLLLVVAVFDGCGEVKESRFATLSAAKEAGLVEKGWVPRWVPESARNIYEIHDLDSTRDCCVLIWSLKPLNLFVCL